MAGCKCRKHGVLLGDNWQLVESLCYCPELSYGPDHCAIDVEREMKGEIRTKDAAEGVLTQMPGPYSPPKGGYCVEHGRVLYGPFEAADAAADWMLRMGFVTGAVRSLQTILS